MTTMQITVITKAAEPARAGSCWTRSAAATCQRAAAPTRV